MKKIIIAILSCALILMFSACTQIPGNNELLEREATSAVDENSTEAKKCENIASLIEFHNMEDFLIAAGTAVKDGDVADLFSLNDIAIPKGIPENYTLYKITAGPKDVAMWYLPEEYLVDESTTSLAESEQKHFMFIDSRDNYDFDKIINQFGGNRTQLIEDKYFVTNTTSKVVIWEEEGSILWLYFPAEMTISDSETATINRDATVISISESDFDAYCETECISIR